MRRNHGTWLRLRRLLPRLAEPARAALDARVAAALAAAVVAARPSIASLLAAGPSITPVVSARPARPARPARAARPPGLLVRGLRPPAWGPCVREA